MQVKVPYSEIQFRHFKSGIELRYCKETGIFEEHDNVTILVERLGLRYEIMYEPAPPVKLIPSDSNWPNDDDGWF